MEKHPARSLERGKTYQFTFSDHGDLVLVQSATIEKVFMEADAHSGGGCSAYMTRRQYENQRKRPGTEYAFENHTPRGLHPPTGSHLPARSAMNASDD